MRLFLSAILAIILIGAGWFFFVMSRVSDLGPVYQQIELKSSRKEKIYIKSKNWGVTGDSQLTVIEIEAGREFDVDSTRQVLFAGLPSFLYKVKGDTLFLVVRQKTFIPNSFESGWSIIQKEVDNPTMIRLLNSNEYKGI